MKRFAFLVVAMLAWAGASAQVNIYTTPPIFNAGSVPITGGTLSGVGKDTMASDAAARQTTFAGANAYPQATVNTTGGALAISAGIGRRIVTVVDYSLIDAATDTITITINGTANVGTEGANDATHWKAETSNAVTATNIATWAEQLSGVSATSVGAVVYITGDATTYSLTIATSMAAGEGTVTSGTDGNLTIVGGSGTNTLNNVVIGGTTAAAGSFTTLSTTGATTIRAGQENLVGLTFYDATYGIGMGSGTLRIWGNAGQSTIIGVGNASGYDGYKIAQFLSSGGTDVNWLTVTSTATTAGPILSVDGETNVPLNIATKGTGIMSLKYGASAAITINNATATGLKFNGYGAGAITSDASGNLTAVSDENLKTDIRPFKAGLREIVALARSGGPMLYKWREGSGMETQHSYPGFGAQHVQAVIPEAVMANRDGYLSLQDRGILAAVVNAIAELEARAQ